jgi:transposase InsO family protein
VCLVECVELGVGRMAHPAGLGDRPERHDSVARMGDRLVRGQSETDGDRRIAGPVGPALYPWSWLVASCVSGAWCPASPVPWRQRLNRRRSGCRPDFLTCSTRDVTAQRPSENRVGDSIDILTGEGWVSLATVIDCSSTSVIGWATG